VGALSAVDMVVVFDEDTPAEAIAALKPDLLVKGPIMEWNRSSAPSWFAPPAAGFCWRRSSRATPPLR